MGEEWRGIYGLKRLTKIDSRQRFLIVIRPCLLARARQLRFFARQTAAIARQKIQATIRTIS